VPQSFVSLNCHIVFSTKNREPLIAPPVTDRLYSYIGGVFRGEGATLMAAGGMPDHVHLFVSLGKTNSVANLLRVVKTNSSKWIHETFREMGGFAWQTGYGAFAVSCSNSARIKRYIADQKEHHRARSFKDEFLALLERHGLDYDERYIWE
jgi:putative transposase